MCVLEKERESVMSETGYHSGGDSGGDSITDAEGEDEYLDRNMLVNDSGESPGQ